MNQLGIIFDMDGVVVDNDDFHIQAWIATARQYGIALTKERYQQEMNGRTMASCMEMLFGDRISKEEQRRFGEEKESAYRKLYEGAVQSAKGLPALLGRLQSHHIPIGLATSAPPVNVDFILKHTGLRSFFQSIVDDTGVTT